MAEIEEAVCVGCGRDCLSSMECSCGRQEVNACEDCLDSDITPVCGNCRGRAARVVLVGSHPCRDFREDEAGTERDPGERLPVTAPVVTWGTLHRAS